MASLRSVVVFAGVGFTAVQPLAAQDVEKCPKPVGTLAVVEPNAQTLASLRRYNLDTPTSLIRMMAQQSNCFVVVERGQGMQTMETERRLASQGELQQGSNVGGGQMQAADFYLTPNVIFSEGNAGGIGAAVGGALSRKSGGAVAGGLKFKEAQTSMLVGDVRSGIQIASAEGKAKKGDISLGGAGIFGGAMGAAAGGYTHTNEGKVIAASFLNNYNKIVLAIRNDPNLKNRDVSALRSGTGGDRKAGAAMGEGDVYRPKIDNVKLLSGPSDKAGVVAVLKKSEELVFLGEEQDGYVHVQGANGEGWVKKVLVIKN